MGIVIPILIYIIGLYILYIIIKTAVREGINSSDVVEILIKKHEDNKDDQRSNKQNIDADK